MKYLIVGLGNPGAQYEKTRHNIGFMVLDELSEKLNTPFESSRYADISKGKFKGKQLILIKPSTFMNLSGKAVRFWMNEENIPVENILIVTDDLSLPFAKLRMKGKGSNGGHNGLGNIQDLLGTTKYPRLRFGVGDDYPKGQQVDYVLSPFNPEEQKKLPDYLATSCDMITSFCTAGLERTMNQYN